MKKLTFTTSDDPGRCRRGRDRHDHHRAVPREPLRSGRLRRPERADRRRDHRLAVAQEETELGRFTEIGYTIVGGVPAAPTRPRIAPETAARLIELAWWDWDHATLRARLDDFRALSAEGFFEKYAGAPVSPA